MQKRGGEGGGGGGGESSENPSTRSTVYLHTHPNTWLLKSKSMISSNKVFSAGPQNQRYLNTQREYKGILDTKLTTKEKVKVMNKLQMIIQDNP